MIAELDGTDTLVASYTHGPGIDDPLVMRYDGDDYFYHKNHLGSIMEITNIYQSTVKTYDYDAFGKILGESGSLGHNAFTYTGREYHPRSGLYYYRARFYDPAIGRFITPDPVGHLGGVNLYAYVGNEPTMFIDPIGLITFQIGLSGTGGGGKGATYGSGIVFGYSRQKGFQYGTYDVIGGGGYGGVGGSFTLDLTYSGNKDINQLAGPAATIGASAEVPFAVIGGASLGGEANIPLSEAKPSFTFSPGVAGGPVPFEMHVFYTHTFIHENQLPGGFATLGYQAGVLFANKIKEW